MKSIIVRILPGILCAFAALTAQAELGFYRADDPRIPPAVREASKAVYQLGAQAGTGKIYETEKWLNAFNDKGQEYFRDQIRSCHNGGLKYCEIFNDFKGGSAFTLNSGSRLYTNLHNFIDLVHMRVKNLNKNITSDEFAQRMSSDAIFMTLKGSNSKWLFYSMRNSAHFDFIWPDISLLTDWLNENEYTAQKSFIDFVRINLSIELSNYLRLSKTRPQTGDRVFLIGYPGKTTNRKMLGGSDSDGKSLYISMGNVVDNPAWNYRSKNPQLTEIENQNFIFSTVDSERGNSGGALVNQAGEVIGIHVASLQSGESVQEKVRYAYKRLDELENK